MRLFVIDPETNKKLYLKHNASTRKELAEILGATNFKADENYYSVSNVSAEPSDNTAESMALGGAVGVLGGVPGVILGGIIGGLIGKNSQENDARKAEIFNGSQP